MSVTTLDVSVDYYNAKEGDVSRGAGRIRLKVFMTSQSYLTFNFFHQLRASPLHIICNDLIIPLQEQNVNNSNRQA